MRISLLKTVPGLIFLLFLTQVLSAYYFRDDFDSLNPLWRTDYSYGMEGYLVTGGNDNIAVTNSTLTVDGNPYTACCSFNGTWSGNTYFLTNYFSASETQPFGFEVYRSESQIDGDTSQDVNSATRSENQLDIWLISGQNIPTVAYESYSDFYLLFERGTRGNANEPYDFYGNPINRSRFGVFSEATVFLDLAKASNYLGTEYDIGQESAGYHSLNFPYMWEGNNDGAGGTGDFPGPNIANTNDIIFRIVHDGSTVSTWVNMDPDDNDEYPNEFLLVHRRRVFWNEDLAIMLGHEVKNDNMYEQRAVYDYLLIRSSIEASGFQYEYNQPGRMDLDLWFQVGEGQAGVNTIEVENLKLQTDPRSKINIQNQNGEQVAIHKVIQQNIKTQIILSEILHKDSKLQLQLPVNTAQALSAKPYVYLEARQYEDLKGTWGKAGTVGRQRVLLDEAKFLAVGK